MEQLRIAEMESIQLRKSWQVESTTLGASVLPAISDIFSHLTTFLCTISNIAQQVAPESFTSLTAMMAELRVWWPDEIRNRQLPYSSRMSTPKGAASFPSFLIQTEMKHPPRRMISCLVIRLSLDPSVSIEKQAL